MIENEFTTCDSKFAEKQQHDLGKKLFSDFNKAIEQLDKIEEIGTIFSDDKCEIANSCPIHVESCYIGVEKWCIKYLYSYAYHKFICIKDGIDTGASNNNTSSFTDYTRCVVLFCADCTTAWNARKLQLQCIFKKQTFASKLFVDELHLTKLALRRHPKSTEAFAHRRWILKEWFKIDTIIPHALYRRYFCQKCDNLQFPNFHNQGSLTTYAIDWTIVENELKVCCLAADWHKCNYNSWSHRIWALQNLIYLPLVEHLRRINYNEDETQFSKRASELLHSELDIVMNWVELNVSDHSSMAYAQHVLLCITAVHAIKCDCVCMCGYDNGGTLSSQQTVKSNWTKMCEIWLKTFKQSNDLLTLHDGRHEALWMHRRGLMLIFHKFAKNILKNCPTNANVDTELHKQLSNFYTYNSETNFCDKLGKVNADVTVHRFAENYLKYIVKFVL